MRKRMLLLFTLSMMILSSVFFVDSISAQSRLTIGDDISIALEKTESFAFTIVDSNNQVVTINRWDNSNPQIAEISGNQIKALEYGTTVLIGYAISGNSERMIRIEVNVLDGIAFTQNNIELDVDELLQSEVITNPSANISNLEVIYTSADESIVSVSNTGQLVGLKVGETTISANFLGFIATLDVKVVDRPDFAFSQSKLQMNLYDSVVPHYTLSVHGGKDNTIEWQSVDQSIVSVDNNGRLYAHKAGTTTIEATVLNEKYLLEVSVMSGITDFKLDQQEITISLNQSYTMGWTITPENSSQQAITWTTNNPSVAKVNNGIIEALGAGSAIIKATIDGFVEEVKVNVIVGVDSVSVMPKSLKLSVNETTYLSVIYKPNNTTFPKNPKFTSTNPEIASVDERGLVRAKSVGETVIFVEDFGFTISVNVSVESSSNHDNKQLIIGSINDENEVTFDTIPLDEVDNVLLEIPYSDKFDQSPLVNLRVIINDSLLDKRKLVAQGLFLNRMYQGQSIELDFFNQHNEWLFTIHFDEFDLIENNLFINGYPEHPSLKTSLKPKYFFDLPFSIDASTIVTIACQENEPIQYLYHVTKQLTLQQLNDVQLTIADNNQLQLHSLIQGTYLISSQNNAMILNDFAIYFVSGGALLIILGTILYKFNEMRQKDRQAKEEEFEY